MVGAQLNKFIFSLTITDKTKLLWYNDLETTYRLFKIDNLGKIIIFKKIANYAESLPWYNVWIKTSLGTLWVIRTKGFFINHRDLSRWLTKSRGPILPIMCQERYLYILHNKAMYLLYKLCINNKINGNALTCLIMS